MIEHQQCLEKLLPAQIASFLFSTQANSSLAKEKTCQHKEVSPSQPIFSNVVIPQPRTSGMVVVSHTKTIHSDNIIAIRGAYISSDNDKAVSLIAIYLKEVVEPGATACDGIRRARHHLQTPLAHVLELQHDFFTNI